jgi:two-component system phosphate regulon sensor histidine kinase PhoR
MFWRLLATYLILVTGSVGLVGVLILRQNEGSELFRTLAWEVVAAVGSIVVLAMAPAYLFARRFTRPLEQLTDGANRLASGDFSQQIQTRGAGELKTLARAFNAMTAQLATSFEEIAREREQLRIILSGMIEGVVAIDDSQRVLFANDRAGIILEFDSKQAVGRKLWELTRQRAVREMVEKALAGDEPQRQEVEWKGPGDRRFALYVSRLSDPTSSSGAVLVLHDTTELRKLERMRQDFVTNVSHELKTPLANIKSSVETLLDGAAEEPASRSMFLAEIDQQSVRLEALIQDLLSLARIESGEMGLEFEAVRIEDAVHACLDRHRTRAEAKGLTLNAVSFGGTPSHLAAWVDEEGLAQILDNLVDNAIKYTPDHGRITVRWRVVASDVIFEVEDTGYGIPQDDLPRIFERFYRVDKARSREMGGTGLGLAIVKHLAQAMKGSIHVESCLGQWTKFTVKLPTASPNE